MLIKEALKTIEGAARLVTEEEIRIIEDYCLAIRVLLKRKPLYPLKPGGLQLYEELLKIKISLKNCCGYASNHFIKQLFCLLSEILNDVSTLYQYVRAMKQKEKK